MPETLASAWARTLRQRPDAIALIDTAHGRTWSRAELSAEAARTRAGWPVERLRRRKVVMAERNGIDWWRTFLALLEIDAIPVPLDATEPEAAQQVIAREVGAAARCRAGELLEVTPRPAMRRPELALVKLTSGSSGGPAACAFTHAQLLADGRQICVTMGVRPDDLNLAIIPPGHSYGLGNLVVPLLDQGTAVMSAGSPLPQAIAADCARWRPTIFPAVPALLRALVRTEIEPAALASLRLVISAGAPLAPEVAVAFAERFGRRVHGFYGTTETGGITFDRTGEAALTGRSVGPPLEGVTIAFGRGQRFRVSGAAVARGSHRPADRAQWTALGELELLGRSGRTVKIGGRRLELGEIEAALRGLAGVREAFAMPASGRSETIVAVAVSTDRVVEELKAELRVKLAPWKVPDRWLGLREFPLTARGKTDTRRLRELLTGGRETGPAQISTPKSK